MESLVFDSTQPRNSEQQKDLAHKNVVHMNGRILHSNYK